MKLNGRIFYTETLVWTNTKVLKSLFYCHSGLLCLLVLGFWRPQSLLLKESLALGKLSLEKHCLCQKRYKYFVRRRIWTHKTLVYSERIMNYLWTPMDNCSLINDINPCKSGVLWWQRFCPSSAKHWDYAFGTKEMISPQKFTQRQDFT